jgi:hypothetical protein
MEFDVDCHFQGFFDDALQERHISHHAFKFDAEQ